MLWSFDGWCFSLTNPPTTPGAKVGSRFSHAHHSKQVSLWGLVFRETKCWISVQCCHWFCAFNPQREEVVWDWSECSKTSGTCESNLQALIKMDWSHIWDSTPRSAIHAVSRLYVDVPMYHWWANILQHLGRSNSQHWDIVAISSSISTYINWCRILSMNSRTRVEYRCLLLCLPTSSEIDLELPILGKKDANMEPTEKRRIFVSVCFFAEKILNNQVKSHVSAYVSFSIVMCQQHVQYIMYPYMYVHTFIYRVIWCQMCVFDFCLYAAFPFCDIYFVFIYFHKQHASHAYVL